MAIKTNTPGGYRGGKACVRYADPYLCPLTAVFLGGGQGHRASASGFASASGMLPPYQWPDTQNNPKFDWPGLVWEGGCFLDKSCFEVGLGLIGWFAQMVLGLNRVGMGSLRPVLDLQNMGKTGFKTGFTTGWN